MINKLKLLIVSLVFMLCNTAPVLAEGGGGEGGGNQQSPIQIIVQIALTAIILRVLSIFKLP
jgi:hypothetical protein